jgi:hypothetical protein
LVAIITIILAGFDVRFWGKADIAVKLTCHSFPRKAQGVNANRHKPSALNPRAGAGWRQVKATLN